MKIKNIKFKAKQLNSGKWFEGDLVRLGNRVCIGGDHINDGITDVDPSTVCMFTGLKDCEGKELFEHDLIHFVGFTHTAEVIWSEGNYAFMVVSENKHSYWLHDVIKVCRIERIGNKFDKKK
nr:MAG TPA: YopX protein [Caudoviricetes sp.]